MVYRRVSGLNVREMQSQASRGLTPPMSVLGMTYLLAFLFSNICINTFSAIIAAVKGMDMRTSQ